MDDPAAAAASPLTYDAMHEQLRCIAHLSRAALGSGPSAAESRAGAEQRLNALLLALRHQSHLSRNAPSARVAEAQALMQRAVLCRGSAAAAAGSRGEQQREAQAYFDASALWFSVERERREMNFPTTDDALARGVLCGAMGCAALLRDVPDLRESPMPQHCAAALHAGSQYRSNVTATNNNSTTTTGTNAAAAILNNAPRMPSPHMTRAWAELMRIGAVLEEFHCLELAANYYEIAAVILLEDNAPKPAPEAEHTSALSSSSLSFPATVSQEGAASEPRSVWGLWSRVGGALRQLRESKANPIPPIPPPSSSSSSPPLPLPLPLPSSAPERACPSEDEDEEEKEKGESIRDTDVRPCFPALVHELSLALHRAAMACAAARDYPRALLYTDKLLRVLRAEFQRRRPCHEPPQALHSTAPCSASLPMKESAAPVGPRCMRPAAHTTWTLPTTASLPRPCTTAGAAAFLTAHLSRWVQLLVLKILILVHLREDRSAAQQEETETALSTLDELANEVRRIEVGVLCLGAERHGRNGSVWFAPTRRFNEEGTNAAPRAGEAQSMAQRLLQSDAMRRLCADIRKDNENNPNKGGGNDKGQTEAHNRGQWDVRLRKLAAELRGVRERVRAYPTGESPGVDTPNEINETKETNEAYGAPAARMVLRGALTSVEAHLAALGMRSRTLTIVGQRMLHEVFCPPGIALHPPTIPNSES